ncbi:GGDEF domain-containing response regulator [Litoribrevibacter albus]|uniref:diguanylate cyclase n=1 Tax=Litoribrevibacter albus TaxID=1473156 RepID=A0AA37W428_9GAMM|nr:diguanylate cyclase [Litoribrevibacter albus]GLQ29727.1 diguanylate cyclase response regulator [Litoribrevibacter albus]
MTDSNTPIENTPPTQASDQNTPISKATTQSRRLISTWQAFNKAGWTQENLKQLQLINQRLIGYSERYQDEDHLTVAQAIEQVIAQCQDSLEKSKLDLLTQRVRDLAKITLRKSDKSQQEETPPQLKLRKPIYLAITDTTYAAKLAKQLSYFGLQCKQLSTKDELEQHLRITPPSILLIETNFCGTQDSGVELIQQLKDESRLDFPVSFLSLGNCTLETRLKAIRTGSKSFYVESVDPGRFIESIDVENSDVLDNDYRVLVLDDSRSQAHFIDTTLKKAKMTAKVITDPLLILDTLEEFQPDLVVLDMYMPGCTGSELAHIIRQHEKWVSMPIVFLSAEDDINKQLQAMSLGGGDDFLTKPINPDHLIRTIRNRGSRAKSLLALMVRDSLTGLYNHTHSLHKLDNAIQHNLRDKTPLSFAMLDIDHFKKVNDTYGHPIGDKVIKSLALFLKQRLRKTDVIGRYGGEEFAVVLPNTSATDAVMILNEILSKFRNIAQSAGEKDFNVTFSCGIAALAPEIKDASALSELADKALYEAKRAGRNCVRLYSGTE